MSRPYACQTATCGRVSAHPFGARGCTARTPDAPLALALALALAQAVAS